MSVTVEVVRYIQVNINLPHFLKVFNYWWLWPHLRPRIRSNQRVWSRVEALESISSVLLPGHFHQQRRRDVLRREWHTSIDRNVESKRRARSGQVRLLRQDGHVDAERDAVPSNVGGGYHLLRQLGRLRIEAESAHQQRRSFYSPIPHAACRMSHSSTWSGFKWSGFDHLPRFLAR